MVIGKWIVYEGHFFDRWIAREIVGETEQFWVLRRKLTQAQIEDGGVAEEVRKKKMSIGRHWVLDDEEDAERLAEKITDELKCIERDRRELVRGVFKRVVSEVGAARWRG